MGVNPSYLENNISNFNLWINSIRFFLPTFFLFNYYLIYGKKDFFHFLNFNYLINLLFIILILIFIFSLSFEFLDTQNLYFLIYLNIFLLVGILASNADLKEIINNIILFILLGFCISLILIITEISNYSFSLSELHKFRVFSFDARF
tara:strand:- start:11 stop:454 length:444 start_codon:yes stop_codon:yes gene_type:complete